jgi:Response regulator receiver domain
MASVYIFESTWTIVSIEDTARIGLELQEALAQSEEPLPVIFVTAHGDVSSSVRAMKKGAVDVFARPMRGDELLEAVQRALAWGAACPGGDSLRVTCHQHDRPRGNNQDYFKMLSPMAFLSSAACWAVGSVSFQSARSIHFSKIWSDPIEPPLSRRSTLARDRRLT